MSQDRPAVEDLLEVTRQFVASIVPHVPGDLRYSVQVATHILGIAEREIRYGAEYARNAKQRIESLISPGGNTADLSERLCKGIRAGEFDDDWARVVDTVLDIVVEKVSIVRPDRLHPMHSHRSRSRFDMHQRSQ